MALRRGGLDLFVAALAIVGSAAIAAAEQTREPFRYDSKGRRDPFAVLVRDGRVVGVTQDAQVATSRPVLRGILWDPGGHSIALINDVEARIGDTINGYRVQDIRQDMVVLDNGGEPVVLQIAFEPSPSGSLPDTTTGGDKP